MTPMLELAIMQLRVDYFKSLAGQLQMKDRVVTKSLTGCDQMCIPECIHSSHILHEVTFKAMFGFVL